MYYLKKGKKNIWNSCFVSLSEQNAGSDKNETLLNHIFDGIWNCVFPLRCFQLSRRRTPSSMPSSTRLETSSTAVACGTSSPDTRSLTRFWKSQNEKKLGWEGRRYRFDVLRMSLCFCRSIFTYAKESFLFWFVCLSATLQVIYLFKRTDPSLLHSPYSICFNKHIVRPLLPCLGSLKLSFQHRTTELMKGRSPTWLLTRTAHCPGTTRCLSQWLSRLISCVQATCFGLLYVASRSSPLRLRYVTTQNKLVFVYIHHSCTITRNIFEIVTFWCGTV